MEFFEIKFDESFIGGYYDMTKPNYPPECKDRLEQAIAKTNCEHNPALDKKVTKGVKSNLAPVLINKPATPGATKKFK